MSSNGHTDGIGAIRPFQVADADAVGELVNRHAAYEQAPAPPRHVGLALADLVRQHRLWCWVVDTPTAGLIGYATTTEDVATFTGLPFGHLDCLFVDDAWRSMGIGQRLMNTRYQLERTTGTRRRAMAEPRLEHRGTSVLRQIQAHAAFQAPVLPCPSPS